MEASRIGLRARQPFKTLWTLFAAAQALLYIPLWTLYYIPPGLRQNPNWTFRKAILCSVVKFVLHHFALLKVGTKISLEPGPDKDRWVVISPAEREMFKGLAAPDAEISPTPVGAAWFPSPPQSSSKRGDEIVVLHFHGGAFVLGTGRSPDADYTATLCLDEAGADRMLSVQYRLASNPHGQFPAALQDAISAYIYLLCEQGVPAANIVVSGDSAGGNLVLALLRYIAEHGKEVGLPAPACAWLWSPWVDVAAVLRTAAWDRNPNEKTDYLPNSLGVWGATAYSTRHGADNRYITPVREPFRTETPLWMMAGGAEVLLGEIAEMARAMERIEGNQVELWVEPDVVHDICLVGEKFGFDKQSRACGRRAGAFMRRFMSHEKSYEELSR